MCDRRASSTQSVPAAFWMPNCLCNNVNNTYKIAAYITLFFLRFTSIFGCRHLPFPEQPNYFPWIWASFLFKFYIYLVSHMFSSSTKLLLIYYTSYKSIQFNSYIFNLRQNIFIILILFNKNFGVISKYFVIFKWVGSARPLRRLFRSRFSNFSWILFLFPSDFHKISPRDGLVL